MKKLVVVLLLFFPLTVFAVNVQVTNKPDSSGPCTLINGDGNDFTAASKVLTVSTPPDDGTTVVVFVCRGQVSSSQNQAVQWDNTSPGFEGVQCEIFDGNGYVTSTDEWKETVSAPVMSVRGKKAAGTSEATLTCLYRQ